MKFRSSKVAGWIALLSGASALLACGAETPGKPAVPDSGLSAALTNLSRSGPRKDGLKQLEEELSKSLQPFSTEGSLDSILMPRYITPPVVVPNRRPQSDLEKRNWMLPKPEDANAFNQDPFKALEGSGTKGSWDELYRSFGNERARGSAGSAKPDGSTRQGLKPSDDLDDETAKLPNGLRESAKSLRDKLLGSDSVFNQAPSRSRLSDLFTPEEGGLTQEQIKAHKEYVERFRQTLDIPAPWAATVRNPLSTPLGGNNSATTPAYTGPSSLNPPGRRDTFASSPAAADSMLHPNFTPDPDERVLNQWNPLYAPPTVGSSRIVPFASPPVEAPRRKF
ncbi:MAG TPA: hypothetical protein VJA21_04385 [Verrucomicrobiae bacterium]